jgi:hypothetical protein
VAMFAVLTCAAAHALLFHCNCSSLQLFLPLGFLSYRFGLQWQPFEMLYAMDLISLSGVLCYE